MSETTWNKRSGLWDHSRERCWWWSQKEQITFTSGNGTQCERVQHTEILMASLVFVVVVTYMTFPFSPLVLLSPLGRFAPSNQPKLIASGNGVMCDSVTHTVKVLVMGPKRIQDKISRDEIEKTDEYCYYLRKQINTKGLKECRVIKRLKVWKKNDAWSNWLEKTDACTDRLYQIKGQTDKEQELDVSTDRPYR